MPSDIHMLEGPKVYCEDLDVVFAKVREIYPQFFREGAVGSYHFYLQKEGEEKKIIGEAWLHRTKPGWWLRLIKKDE
jgi:hypothetical protein